LTCGSCRTDRQRTPQGGVLGRAGAANQRSIAVNHGAQRTTKLAAPPPYRVVTGPQVRIWHARGQGFKSPQLHQPQRLHHPRARCRLPEICQRITKHALRSTLRVALIDRFSPAVCLAWWARAAQRTLARFSPMAPPWAVRGGARPRWWPERARVGPWRRPGRRGPAVPCRGCSGAPKANAAVIHGGCRPPLRCLWP
jgi:hypothetical protein